MKPIRTDKRRIEAIDLARGAALLAMAVYHFAWDLQFFGYAPAGMTGEGGWRLFARVIASSFLFLVGVSLALAHAESVRWRSFLIRFAMIAAAAVAISLATWFAVPQGFIFFGILHHIALASLFGLAFLRLPVAVVLLAAVAAAAAPSFLRAPLFDHPLLWWVGLSQAVPRSNDYVPLLPWFWAVLAGIAAARLGRGAGLLDRLATIEPARWTRPIRVAGRHSLLVYLVHQPILIGVIWLFAQLAPPAPAENGEAAFYRACNSQCAELRSVEFCAAYCVCVLDTLAAEDRLSSIFDGEPDAETGARLQEIAAQCTLEANPMQQWDEDG